jgi:hypothetical protein
MNDDIGSILKTWKYLPNDLNVRIIVGDDGKEKLQMRIDLGMLQMELDGRPDGRRPHKFDSYLSYYEHRAKERPQEAKSPFALSPVDCLRLQQEAIQFYHRYIALMRLGDYERVARDTRRNLTAFNFVARHTRDKEIIWAFEQYRPYVIMMHIRARASLYIDKENYAQAERLIEKGLAAIKRYYRRYHDKVGENMAEAEILGELLQDIRQQKPLSEREKLQLQMERAIQEEAYEVAAHLRDRLQHLDKHS